MIPAVDMAHSAKSTSQCMGYEVWGHLAWGGHGLGVLMGIDWYEHEHEHEHEH